MGNAMHSLKTLLQLPCGWQYSRQVISPDGITLHLRGKRKTAQCSECLKCSDSVHSCRRRRIQHLPCLRQTLWFVFSVRHWYCRNPVCSRKIFAESLAPFASSHQQSSQALPYEQLLEEAEESIQKCALSKEDHDYLEEMNETTNLLHFWHKIMRALRITGNACKEKRHSFSCQFHRSRVPLSPVRSGDIVNTCSETW